MNVLYTLYTNMSTADRVHGAFNIIIINIFQFLLFSTQNSYFIFESKFHMGIGNHRSH